MLTNANVFKSDRWIWFNYLVSLNSVWFRFWELWSPCCITQQSRSRRVGSQSRFYEKIHPLLPLVPSGATPCRHSKPRGALQTKKGQKLYTNILKALECPIFDRVLLILWKCSNRSPAIPDERTSSNLTGKLELQTFNILAAEQLRLIRFDNRLIID